MIKRFSLAIWLFVPAVVYSRPLFLEPAGTAGRYAFESVISVSVRQDQFGSPRTHYESESFPITLRVGLHSRFDLGVTIQHVSHHVEFDNLRLSGSDSGRMSPEFKWAIRNNISIQGIWHANTNEEADQSLPIGRGDSPELRILATVPTAWPLCIDAGYFKQGRYNGRLGIASAPLKNIDPGDVADLRLALLVPLPANFSVSLESIYSHIGEEQIDGVNVPNTRGEALDAFLGLSWNYKDVALGLGAGAGLLDESHTSFAIDRGAGDLTVKFLFSYKLQPHKAGI